LETTIYKKSIILYTLHPDYVFLALYALLNIFETLPITLNLH